MRIRYKRIRLENQIRAGENWSKRRASGDRKRRSCQRGNLCHGNERQGGFTGRGGQRGNGNQKGNACARRRADPDGSPYRAEPEGGVASPASIMEKDRRRRRPRLPGSGPEPPLVVAILPLRRAEASGPFQSRIGLSRLPPAPSL